MCEKTEAFEYNEGIIPDKAETRQRDGSDKMRTLSERRILIRQGLLNLMFK